VNRSELIAETKKIVDLANSKWPRLQLPMPTIGFFTKTYVAGRAYIKDNKIEYNTSISRINGQKFTNTVIHEVAHLVTHKIRPYAKQAHGPEFKQIMAVLGGEPSRCHNYDVTGVKAIKRTQRKFVYTCGCREMEFSTRRHNSGKKYSCTVCGGTCKFTGKVV
jgi:SprT protein